MTIINAQNERIKRDYLDYLKEARGLAETSIDQALNAIKAFEEITGGADFKTVKKKQAIGFRNRLMARADKAAVARNGRTTAHGVLTHLKQFFGWLKLRPGFRRVLHDFDPDYFKLSLHDVRIAQTRFEKPSPSLEQLQHIIRTMPFETDIQKRDRAVVALILLTGVRVKALTTLKLRHVRDDRLGIDHDARDMATKFGKSFPSFFFPVGDDIRQIFLDYVEHMRRTLRYNLDDPLFPSTRQGVRNHTLEVMGLTREHWRTTDTVRDIFKRAFAAAELPYYHPHTVRRTLSLLSQQLCKTPEALKAWSQNLGHEGVLTTFASYGAISHTRQSELIRNMAKNEQNPELTAEELALLKQVAAKLSG